MLCTFYDRLLSTEDYSSIWNFVLHRNKKTTGVKNIESGQDPSLKGNVIIYPIQNTELFFSYYI